MRATALGIAGTRVLTFCSAQCKGVFFEVEKERQARAAAEVAAAEALRLRRKIDPHAVADGSDDGAAEADGSFRSWWRRSGTPATVALFGVVGFCALAAAGYRLLEGVTRPEPRKVRPVNRPKPEVKPRPVGPRVVQAPRPAPFDSMKARNRARKVLAEFLVQDGSRHQLIAAEALTDCCDEPKALDVLMTACKDSLWTRRQRAAAALARLGRKKGIQVLKRDLRSKRRSVRWAAAFTLSRLGQKSGLPVIRPLLRRKRYRLTCAEALIKLGSLRARQVLVSVLQDQQYSSSERLRAAVALGKSGDGIGLPLLRKTIEDQRVHLGAALALARLGDSKAVPALRRALSHTALRLEAARALRRIGGRVKMRDLARRMDDPDAHGRISAAAAVVMLIPAARAER